MVKAHLPNGETQTDQYVSDALNRMGDAGWALAGTLPHPDRFFFRRPSTEAWTPPAQASELAARGW